MKIVILILMCFFLQGCFSEKKSFKKDETKITMILGVENRGKLTRGWNDITMFIVERKKYFQIISFPRDTLVYINPKGHWTINTLYLVTGGAAGTANYFNYQFKNLKINNYIVLDVYKMFNIVSNIQANMKLPKRHMILLEKYKYVNDWIRHRHKFGAEIHRQTRIHAFIDYLIRLNQKEKLNSTKLLIIANILKSLSDENNMKIKDMIQLYNSILKKPVKYHIWDGTYTTVYFNLQHEYNKIVFQKGEKVVWRMKHKDLERLTNEYLNSHIFSFKEFFKKTGDKFSYKFKPGILSRCVTWNGGFTINRKRLITDYEFTNQNWTDEQIYKFCKSFKKNRFTTNEMNIIIKNCRKNTLSAWIVLSTMEKESCLVKNENSVMRYAVLYRRAMGYDCKKIGIDKYGDAITKNSGFEVQIIQGTKCLRKWFDRYQNGIKIYSMSFEGTFIPKNAATYALYKYTPFYGEAFPYGKISVGNRRFMTIWYNFKRKRQKMKL